MMASKNGFAKVVAIFRFEMAGKNGFAKTPRLEARFLAANDAFAKEESLSFSQKRHSQPWDQENTSSKFAKPFFGAIRGAFITSQFAKASLAAISA